MKSLEQCIIYTQDTLLAKKVDGILKLTCVVRHIDDPQQLETTLNYNASAILLFDLRGHEMRRLLPWVLHDFKKTLVIALADKNSIPAREAEAMGVYAVESLDIERGHFNNLVSHAQDYLKLIKENILLKSAAAETAIAQSASAESTATESPAKILTQFFKAFRNFDNINAMIEGMIEGISSCAKISRVGIFAITEGANSYQLIAGNKCLEDSYKIKVPIGDPIVHWMNINAHIISRSVLVNLDDTAERLLLGHWLDMFGAEAIVPLYGRKCIIGWIFAGRRATGAVLDQTDLENLSMLGDHVSAILENALLYEKLTAQNALTDTVFDSVPAGIVAVDAAGVISWINKAAEEMLKVSAADIKGQIIERLSTQLADQLNRSIKGLPTEGAVEWVDPDTKRSLSVVARKLTSGSDNLSIGAVALIHDFTRERTLKIEERRVARAAFWTDLAAAMSHEVRNPLVAISTFAQLLPDFYEDPEFRDNFSQLVSKEVSRLNAMVDQINEFANYPDSDLNKLDIKIIIKAALSIVDDKLQENKISIDVSYENITTDILGDKDSLPEAIAHLLTNSIEILEGIDKPVIKVKVTEFSKSVRNPTLLIKITDNGPGISAEQLEKVFSPFYSSKNRGIGLGLPIAKRIVDDHNGTIIINTNANGGDVTVSLPIC